ESPELGGYGHTVGDSLLNIDTLKFYESLIALDRAGVLPPLRAEGASPLVMEIGAGWGGFGYQFKTVAPGTTYVIVDLPQTILFSATYLRTLFPEAKCRFWSENGIGPDVARGDDGEGFTGADFVFIPHFAFAEVDFPQLDLAINMVSFQEMTTEQVEGYVSRLRKLGCGTLYSHNRDRSTYNPQLTSVADILESHYSIEEVELLEIPYTNLVFPEEHRFSLSGLRHPKQWVRNSLKATLESTRRAAQKTSKAHYRHLIGKAVGSVEPARS
ncbi:MAG: putative sugar O-methyltransferase, partial [Planctomycetota bacterium]